jgi:predicted O-methyltransferase YrrM
MPSTPPGPPSADLDLNRPWRIGEATMAALVAEVRQVRPHVLVEFGSGASSVRLAQAFPDTSILAIDHKAEFLEATRRLAQAHAPGAKISFSLRPLRPQVHAGALYLSYRRGPFPQEVDAVIIDGPPGGTKRGREACLYQVAPYLRLGGRIYLDDFRRSLEQTIVRNWLLAFPRAFRQSVVEVGHRLCVLEKVAPCGAPHWALERTRDSLETHARWWLGGALRRAKRVVER